MNRALSDHDATVIIDRLEQENAELMKRLALMRPALHGLIQDVIRARKEAAQWREKYRCAVADSHMQIPLPRREAGRAREHAPA